MLSDTYHSWVWMGAMIIQNSILAYSVLCVELLWDRMNSFHVSMLEGNDEYLRTKNIKGYCLMIEYMKINKYHYS